MHLLLPLHVIANLFWIGSITAAGALVAAGPGEAEARGKAATWVYKNLAVPAFVVSFILGLGQLARNPSAYFGGGSHYMHGKLTLAVVVIGLHHVIGARAKKLADGRATDAGPTLALTVVLALAAAGTAFLAISRPF